MYIPLVYCRARAERRLYRSLTILNIGARERASARASARTAAFDSRAAALNTRAIIATRHINKRDYSCTMVVNEDHRRRGRPRCICDRGSIRAAVFNADADSRESPIAARAFNCAREDASRRTISLRHSLSLSLSLSLSVFYDCNAAFAASLESGEETSGRASSRVTWREEREERMRQRCA